MRINQFFEQTLGANLRNPRWSWGAIDPVFNRVFLRVWEHQIERHGKGKRVQIYWKHNPPGGGLSERLNHIETIKAGAEGVGIVCQVVGPPARGPWRIKSFNESPLLRLGRLTEDKDLIYAEIGESIPLADLTRSRTAESTLEKDLRGIIQNRRLGGTVKEALVNARLGQGNFRASVLRLWKCRCAVTGAVTLDAIRASHIKPWRDSTNSERLDPRNGLPLVASLDALFDAGFISFEASGAMLISSKLSGPERKIFGVRKKTLAQKPLLETEKYLAYHRKILFQK
jgi:putative restriction endonuclease